MFNQKHNRILQILLCVLYFNGNGAFAQNWEPTNGPFGGPVQCFTENSAFIFAGSTSGVFGKGVFRSIDHGQTWTTVNNGLNPAGMGQDITTMAISNNYVVATTVAGIYRTLNNGDYWTVCNYSGEYYPVTYLNLGSQLLSGGSSGLYVSFDDGGTWTEQNTGFQGITYPGFPEIRSFTQNTVYLYTGTYKKGIFRSTDNGVTWTTVNAGLGTTTQLNTRTFGSLTTDGSDVFAGTSGQGVFRLLNNGTTWTQEIAGLPTGGARSVLSMFIRDTYIYICTNAGIYRSNKSGTMNWTLLTPTPSDLIFTKLFLSGNDFFAATDKGVYKSTDNGLSWSPSFNGMQGLLVTGVSDAGGADLFASTQAGVMNGYYYHSEDSGNTWNIGTKPGSPYLFNNYWFICQNSSIYRSADNGATWQLLIDMGTICTLSSMGNTLFASITCCETLYYSLDNGETWNTSTLNETGGFWSNNILSMDDDGANLYAGTENTGVIKSLDQGVTWSALSSTNWNIPVKVIAVNTEYVFAGTCNIYSTPGLASQGIYRSSDHGVTWEPANSGLGNFDINSLVFNGDQLFAGTKSGIYKSVNNGATWTAVNQGFLIPPVSTSLHVSGNYLYSNNYSTYSGNPVYRLALSGSVPAQPTAISGSSTPCIGSAQTYSVDEVAGVTYTWQFPSGWIITSGNNTHIVTVIAGSVAGIALVTPSNGWGTGTSQYMIVTPTNNPPSQPSFISGVQNPEEGSTQSYHVENVPGVQYTWTFPSGWTQLSGGNSNSVSVQVGNTSGTIFVVPFTPCGNGQAQTLVVNIVPTVRELHVKIFLESLYQGAGLMSKAQNGTGDQFPGNVADQVTIELFDGQNGSLVTSMPAVNLNTDGLLNISLNSALIGDYFIYIKHRNSITVSSAEPVPFTGTPVLYDFSTGVDKAFGSNLKDTGEVFVVYGGDENQDGLVDSTDMIDADNAASEFATGYLSTDVNGDGLVDSSDLVLIDNNASTFISSVLPF